MAAGFAQTGTTHSLTTGPSQLYFYQFAKSLNRQISIFSAFFIRFSLFAAQLPSPTN